MLCYNCEVQRLLLSKEVFLSIKYLKDNFTTMAKIKIKKVKSAIKRTQNQKRTLEALGLRKMNQVVEHENSPNILGMIRKVSHLVSVEEA